MNMRDAVRLLKRAQTPAEQRLWSALRAHQIAGLRFRRQHPIGRFIADFYCNEAKLVVEVDGPIHDLPAQAAHDCERDTVFATLGLRVIRVTNTDVLENLPVVLAQIHTAVTSRCPR